MIDAGIVIPSDFARDLLDADGPSTLQVLLNAMNANTAAISQGYVQGVIQGSIRSPATDVVQTADRPGRPDRAGAARGRRSCTRRSCTTRAV